MKSKACCKISLPSLKALFKRQPWLITLWFLSFFFSLPVVAGMELPHYAPPIIPQDFSNAESFLSTLLGHQHPFFFASIPVGAFVTVLVLFSYLHNRRQIDFFHSQPIPRGQIFTERVITAVLVMLIPYLINVLMTLLIAAALGLGSCIPWGVMVRGILWNTAFYIAIFSIFLFGTLLTGQSAVSVLVSLFLAGVGPALIGLFFACVSNFYRNAYTALWNIEGLIAYTNPLARYWMQYAMPLKAIDIAYLLVFAVLALGFAYWLFLRRPSEGAEKALAFSIARLPIKLPLAVCSTLGLACMFYLFSNDRIWWYLGGIIGAVLCCQIYEIIFAIDFRAIRRRLKELTLLLVVFVAASGIMWSDATGFNTRLPQRADIVKAELLLASFDEYAYNYRITLKPGQSTSEVLEHQRAEYALQQTPLTSAAAIDAAYSIVQKALLWQSGHRDELTYGNSGSMYSGLVVGAGAVEIYDAEKRAEVAAAVPFTSSYYGNYGTSTTVGVRFTLENGKTMQRFYQVNLPVGMIMEELAVISNDEAYMAERYDLFQIPLERLRLNNIGNEAIGVNETANLNKQQQAAMANVPQEQLAELLAVYRSELLAESLDYRLLHSPVGTLRFSFWREDPGICYYDAKADYLQWQNYDDYSYSINYPLYENMHGTMALLEEYYGYSSSLFEADTSTASYLELVYYNSAYYGKGEPLESQNPHLAASHQRFEELVALCGEPDENGEFRGVNAKGGTEVYAYYKQDTYDASLIVYSTQLIDLLLEETQAAAYSDYNALFRTYPDLELSYHYTTLSGGMDTQWLLIPYAE